MALTVIMLWYVGIGVLAAIGTVTITRSRFSPRVEQVFFALLLVPVAGMYLAFVGYFGDSATLRPEAYAVVLFTALGLLGLRLPALLILGYALHGAWDLAHEVAVHLGNTPGGGRQLTHIPLAYGAFCAAYDWCVAGYFFTRRSAWRPATALLLTLGCTGGTEPSTTPRDVRIDPEATATVWGYVYVDPARGLPRRERPGGFSELARGVTIELRRWDEPVAPFGPRPRRMVVIARTQTDQFGRYRFERAPRYAAVSVQVQGSMPEDDQRNPRYEAVIPAQIFWLAHTPERQENLLIWDLSR